jgi:hypothetical protein
VRETSESLTLALRHAKANPMESQVSCAVPQKQFVFIAMKALDAINKAIDADIQSKYR